MAVVFQAAVSAVEAVAVGKITRLSVNEIDTTERRNYRRNDPCDRLCFSSFCKNLTHDGIPLELRNGRNVVVRRFRFHARILFEMLACNPSRI